MKKLQWKPTKILKKALRKSTKPFVLKKDHISKLINGISCSVIGGIIAMLLFQPGDSELISIKVLFIFFAIVFEYYFFIRYKEWKDAIFNLAIIVLLGIILSFQDEMEVKNKLIGYIAFVSILSLIFCTMVSKFPLQKKAQE